jgi:hypothetical protein
MPGLLRGMARTAVVAGTATAVSNRVSRRQGNRWAQQEGGYEEQQADAAPPPPAAPAPDRLQQLKELADLKDRGVLSEQEFAEQKARILNN